MTERLAIKDVTFPEDFSEVTDECVRKRGVPTQYFVVIQELGEVDDLVSRLGRVGKGGRDTKEEIVERLPGEIADALVAIGWLMKHFEIRAICVSEMIQEKITLMKESLKMMSTRQEAIEQEITE